MRKRIAFRALVILLAATVLLSSTGAYNILAYTDMEAVSNSLSAISREQSGASVTEPTIIECGGELVNPTDNLQIITNTAGVLIGDGTAENPYQIYDVEDFLAVNRFVNDATGAYVGGANAANKHFILMNDINISELTSNNFVNPVSGSGCFITTDGAAGPNVYIKLDGNGHKIIGGGVGLPLNISGHDNVAIFGYLGEESEISNVIFENIAINVAYSTPREVAIISYKNDGRIVDCTVKDCSVNIVQSISTHPNPYYDGSVLGSTRRDYNGIAGGVADNAGEIINLTVDGLKITVNGADDYIGGVAAQNRGLIDGCDIFGIKITANGSGSNNNEYIGGIAGLNVSGLNTDGVQNCRVNMQGLGSGYTNNFTKGNYVGGLIGLNEGYLYNSSVTGSVSATGTPTENSYNMLGYLTTGKSYFGGAVGKNDGENAYIKNCTVNDVGFYMDAIGSGEGYYGGITPIITKATEVEKCVATGSFASRETSGRIASCYAGGIIALMDATTPAAATVVDCYALYKLKNPSKDYVGAVIGSGGSPARMVRCYWSDEVSGCASSYYDYTGDIVLGLEAIVGNLTAGKRAVKVLRNTTAAPIPAAELTHSWDNGGAVTISNPTSAMSISTNHPDNTIVKQVYTAAVNMNDSAIGSSDKETFYIDFGLDVFITSSAGDPGDINNPLVITSSAQAEFIRQAPYAHYELGGDVSVSSSLSWSAPMFTGTINGNGNRIYADCPIFKAVIGSRTGGMGSALDTTNRVTNPLTDATENPAYRSMGVVSDLSVELADNITTAIFGSIYNATFVNVSLSDSNPEPAVAPVEEGGNKTIPDTGYLANLTKERTAAFINAAYGNSYIYGCSSDVSAAISRDATGMDNNDMAAFIAYLGGQVNLDNCYLRGNIYINIGNSQNTGRAAFIGNIVNNSGYILNSCISSAVYFTGAVLSNHGFVVFDTCGESNANRVFNIVWTSSETERRILTTPVDTINTSILNGVRVWGGTGASSYTQNTQISIAGAINYNVPLPQNTDTFKNIIASEFNVVSENPDVVEVTGWTIEGNNLVIAMRDGGTEFNNSVWVKIEHTTSGMKTYASFRIASGLDMGADGYYHITSEAVFKEVIGLIRNGAANNGVPYSASAYKLDADIDLSYYDGSDFIRTISPIVGNGVPFTGIFTGDVNEDGTPKYTISNLTINHSGNDVALFGRVDFSGTVLVNNVAMPSGISNIAINGANISGNENVAVLVGRAESNGDLAYGSLPISNVTVKNATVISGDKNNTTVTGRHAGVLVAAVEKCNFNISGITLENNTVYTYNDDSAANLFANASNSLVRAMGGVIGYVSDTTVIDTPSTCTINDVHISGLKLCGASAALGGVITERYAPAHAGAVLGSYQRVVNSGSGNECRTIIIGDSLKSGTQGSGYDDYDILVEDSVIMVKGIAGGVVGVSSASTYINNACVRGTTAINPNTMSESAAASAPMRVLSKTSQYIGGIIGYAGAYGVYSGVSTQSSNLAAVSSVITNSLVENAVIMATDEAISSLEFGAVNRNVVLGGIVGAINGRRVSNGSGGASTFETVEGCQLKNSYLCGPVIGGMVGTVAEWTSAVDSTYNELLNIHIGNCSVQGSKLTTPEICYSLFGTNISDSFAATNGVGGIMATNRRHERTYSAYTTITDCVVDENTSIENYTPYSYVDSSTSPSVTRIACSATGGILGAGFVAKGSAVNQDKTLYLNRNRVDATIRSTAQLAGSGIDNTIDGINGYQLSVGTGGIVGMINGTPIISYQVTTANGCYLPYVKVNRSVFGGKIYGTDCIGGIIGTVSAAYSDDDMQPIDFLSDAVVSGELFENSAYTAAETCHGGVVIGHVVFSCGRGTYNSAEYSFDFDRSDDLSPYFNKIYYSSFRSNLGSDIFPIMGYLFNEIGVDDYSDEYFAATDESAKNSLIGQPRGSSGTTPSYYDVNMNSDFSVTQYPDSGISITEGMAPVHSPETPIGNYMIMPGTVWVSMNPENVSVSTGANFVPTLQGHHLSDTAITIEYSPNEAAYGSDNWERPGLIVGFIAKSNNESGLGYYIDGNNNRYYLIRSVYDLALIGKERVNGEFVFTQNALAYNYWLAVDIDIPDEMYDTDNTFGNGFTPIGTSTLPFTGTLASAPGGSPLSITMEDGTTDTFTPVGETHKITNLKLAATSQDVSGMFGYVTGKNEITQFSNFTLEDVSGVGSSSCAYMGAVAARVKGSLIAENISIINPQLTGANYVGGIFGGFFYSGSGTPITSVIRACSVKADTADSERINIGARTGAAGIVAHTNQYYTNIKGVTVENLTIDQTAATMSSTPSSNGAGGISLAYSGTIEADGTTRNTVKGCTIKGELASGAVVKTYYSSSATNYTAPALTLTLNATNHVVSKNNGTTPVAAGEQPYADFTIKEVDLVDTHIIGTYKLASETSGALTTANRPWASAGILARVDDSSNTNVASGVSTTEYVKHTISDCTLDEDTSVTARYAVGGILGCFNEYNRSTAAATFITVQQGALIDNCKVFADLSTTFTTAISIPSSPTSAAGSVGCGGIIGFFGRYVPLTFTNISDCVVGGTITSSCAGGGIIGGIWNNHRAASTSTSYTGFDRFRLSQMNSHFVSDCVISAQFKMPDGTDAFGNADIDRVGLIVGAVLDGYNITSTTKIENKGIFHYMAESGEFDSDNYPFYNIYFSEYNCPTGKGMLFGHPKGMSTTPSATLYSLNAFDAYVQYCYDLNDKEYTIPSGGDYTISTRQSDRRIGKNVPGIIELDYTDVSDPDNVFNLDIANDITFNTDIGSGYNANAAFAAVSGSPAIAAFDVVGAGGSTTDFRLRSVSALAEEVHITHGSGTNYTITCDDIQSTLNTRLVFTYTNGLKLYASLKINRTSDEYWYIEDGSNKRTYLIFNARNLKALSGATGSASADYIQCFDVFWSLSNMAIADAVNAYIGEKTLSEVYDSAFVSSLLSYKCPNPEFDRINDPRTEVTFEDRYIDSGLYASAGDVKLRELVGDIGPVGSDVYSENLRGAVYNGDGSTPFVGSYTSNTAPSDLRTDSALSDFGSTYVIYGLNLSYKNTTPGQDAQYVGMFDRIGSGVTISGITFIDPKIEVIGADNTDNYAGVLAGTVENATISNITIKSTRTVVDGDSAANGYVKSLKITNPANSYVGGICGEMLGGTVQGFNISGIDVYASVTPKNTGAAVKNVYAGGVAGKAVGVIKGSGAAARVENCGVFVERETSSIMKYVSYAGGIAGAANGTVGDSYGITMNAIDVGACKTAITYTSNTVNCAYESRLDDGHKAADRIGGVVGMANGSLTVQNCSLPGLTATGYDIAGGIIGEVTSGANVDITVEGCSVGSTSQNADVRTIGNQSIISGSTRKFYGVAGGVVGQACVFNSMSISDCRFNGYVGISRYDVQQRNCTAGGIIGMLNDVASASGYLDKVTISGCAVQGSVIGFRKEVLSESQLHSILEFSGAVGGIIGKIYSYGTKTDASEQLISDCIMSAELILYKSLKGEHRNPKPADSAAESSYVGKIIGEVKASEQSGSSNFATLAGSGEGGTLTFGDYVDNVYVSSYPQDINAYGSREFYSNINPVNTAESTYMDINRELVQVPDDEGDGTHDEYRNSFTVGGTVIESGGTQSYTDYLNDTYSDTAVITFDSESEGPTNSSRNFKLRHDNISVGNKEIEFAQAMRVVSSDSATAQIDVIYSGKTTHPQDSTDEYSYGVLTVVSESKDDIVGSIVAQYSYGLEVAITFVSMEIEGNGSELYPFIITQARHFKVVRALAGACYRQGNDIDLISQYNPDDESAIFNSGTGFDPLGTKDVPFVGSYDGAGYVIKNLFISDRNKDAIGFFGYVGNNYNRAILENIHIELSPDGIVGKQYVGGLVGVCKNASVTNCSVADGFVLGKTGVGGLVGNSDSIGGSNSYTSCFTSTNSFAYHPGNDSNGTITGAGKNVGALIGTTNAAQTLDNCFTIGYAGVGSLLQTNTHSAGYGAAGGVIGFISAGTVTMNDCFVGATVSDYIGVTNGSGNYCRGLTVGFAENSGRIVADGVTVAAPRAVTDGLSTLVNPILSRGDSTLTNVRYDRDLMGMLNGSESAAALSNAQLITDGKYTVDIGEVSDSYTAAYADLASLPITVSQKEISDRAQAGNAYSYSGLVYPITVRNMDGSIEFSSSVFDNTDTVDYPEGLDTDMYGRIADGIVDKQTDVLFRDDTAAGTTTVYRNTYSSVAENPSVTGDITTGFKCDNPFITMNQPLELGEGRDYSLVRTVVYPLGQARSLANTICTARQLAAMSNSFEDASGSKFSVIYRSKQLNNNFILTSDIFLESYSFTPISGFKGNFEGNGYTIDRLFINKETDNEVGLFRTLTTGSISNLCITVDKVSGAANVGALAGALVADTADNGVTVRIENCSVELAEKAPDEPSAVGVVGSGRNVGGLVGAAMRSSTNSGGISGSYSSVPVDGVNVVGGLVGYCEQPIENSYAVGRVEARFDNSDAVNVARWNVNAGYVPVTTSSIAVGSANTCGVGGLVGVLHQRQTGSFAPARISACFFAQGETDGQVVVTTASQTPYADGNQYGVGGLVGIDNLGATVETSFSSGNVYFCDGQGDLSATANATVGVGGLAGVTNNPVNKVYSCSAVRAYFGDVTGTVSTGVGGVVGVANGVLSDAYSSGSTVGETSTGDTSGIAYGAGGVLGVSAANGQSTQLYYDINVSAISEPVGKCINGSTFNDLSVKPLTTEYMTTQENFMSLSFGYVNGAYPYLIQFFQENVSLVIRMNALLSIVAVQVDELDVSAATGHGVSMALRIPTSLTYLQDTYNYDFTAANNESSAQSIVDILTNTLSFQRTTNARQDVSTSIRIVSKTTNGTTVTGEDSSEYADLASRTISLSCAPMYGTEQSPYLISSQADVEHIGMSVSERNACQDSFYREWVTPIQPDGTAISGKVHFRFMGYVNLSEGFDRTIPNLSDEVYDGIAFSGMSVDGNGYSLRNLGNTFVDTLDSSSDITNLTFENVSFGGGEHLANTVGGTVEGVNVYGASSGSNAAAIAGTVEAGGCIRGCVANVNYNNGSAAASNVAGIALTNNGTIELSASVGSFAGTGGVNGLGALALSNNGTIKNSFTMGDIDVAYGSDTGIGGFVADNTGAITDCYTRCNINVNNCTESSRAGGFAATNAGSIKRSFAAGRFNLEGTLPHMTTLFVGSGNGTVDECIYDKQIAGKCYYDTYNNAERTLDIIALSNHSEMKSADVADIEAKGYTVSTPNLEGGNYHNIYYPQLTAILDTYGVYDEDSVIEAGFDESMVGEETPESRMYRVLRGYSFISSATAAAPGDNYIDNLPVGSTAALSYDSEHTALWSPIGSIGLFGGAGSTNGRYIAASGTFTATNPVYDYYNRALENPAGLNIVAELTAQAHPNFQGGDGTENSPFVISTKEQVVAISFFGTNPSNHFIVANDIDMSGTDWSCYIDNFRATLYGNGMALSNITIPAAGNNSVFGSINGGTVTSLALAGVSVDSDGEAAGLLASTANGATINDCVVVGELSSQSNSACVGGLIGFAEDTMINGCVTSGKLESDGISTGGIVGTASGTASLSDCLSTAFVNGGTGTAGGILGIAADGSSVTVDNAVFANTVKADEAGNIIGNGTASLENVYYDKQFSVAQGNEECGKSTHYLTTGAALPASMTRVDTVNGSYPVAATVAGGDKSAGFMTALKLASVKLQLIVGIGGVGTVENFTDVVAPSTINSVTAVFGNNNPDDVRASFNTTTAASSKVYTADTSGMNFGESILFGVTYALEGYTKLARYMELNVNKLITLVEYNINYQGSSLDADEGVVLTAFTRGKGSAMAVSAFAAATGARSNGTLCRNMVFVPSEDGYALNVRCELPEGTAISGVSAEVFSNGNSVGSVNTAAIQDDGLNAELSFESLKNQVFDKIVITVTVEDDTRWGIRTINSLV